MDSVGNFLTIIRNGVMASKSFVLAPYSTMKFHVAQLLKEEGFVKDVVVVQEPNAVKKNIKVVLKYVDGESVIHEINRVSTPGSRVYSGVKGIRPVIGGLGVTIVSTNRGILTQEKAKALRVGGEVICTVW